MTVYSVDGYQIKESKLGTTVWEMAHYNFVYEFGWQFVE